MNEHLAGKLKMGGFRIYLLSVALNGLTANPALERVIRKTWSRQRTHQSLAQDVNLT